MTYRFLPLPSIHRSNKATFSGNDARNNTTVTIQAITTHESKKMAAIGGQSGRKVLEGSRSGVVVAEGMVEVSKEVCMLGSAAVGVWKVVAWVVGALVLVLVLVLMVVVVVVRVVRVM